MFRLENTATHNEVVLDFKKCSRKALHVAIALIFLYPFFMIFNRFDLWKDFLSLSIIMGFFIAPISLFLIRWKVIIKEESIVVRSLLRKVKEIEWKNLKRARQNLDANQWWLMDDFGQIIQIPKGRYNQEIESSLNQILQEKMDRLGIFYDCRTYQPSTEGRKNNFWTGRGV